MNYNARVLYLIKILHYRKPHSKTDPLSSSWMYGMGARAGHSPPSESAFASGQLFAVPCKTHPQRAPHTFSVVIKARLAPLSYLGTFLLHQILLPSRAGRWFSVCSPHLMYTLQHKAVGLSSLFYVKLNAREFYLTNVLQQKVLTFSALYAIITL